MKIYLIISVIGLTSIVTFADEQVKDMSDPLAVYTQGGFGFTNKGLNLKFGKTYDTGNPKTMGMNILEIKGIAGDVIGWDSADVTSNSVDSIRLRNFTVDTTNGRGAQIDINYNLHAEAGVGSYSILQALPKWGGLNLYPLVGVGLSFANNALQDDGTIASGFSMPGVLGIVGMYGKYTVNDKIWFNYNPTYAVGLAGSDLFMDHGFEKHSHVLTHEAIASYQITPRLNVRYFANWSQYTNFKDGDHRLEFNYQF